MSLKIRKALITAAGPNQRRLPLQSLTARDGGGTPSLAILLSEMLEAGIEKVGLVLAPGDREAYQAVLSPFSGAIEYLEQARPRGYGDAVLCGREFIGGESFLLQVCDHLYVSHVEASCTRQLLEVAVRENSAVSAVQATHESQLRFFGTVSGSLLHGRRGLYQIENIIEKPTPTLAEQHCVVAGLRSAHYLCFFGMHVLPPALFALLEEESAAVSGARYGLTPSLSRLAQKEKYLALEIAGRRTDLESSFGLLRAQIALGLSGVSRDDVLAVLTEELAADAMQRRKA